MDPRKKRLKRAAAECVNDRYIHPQKYRDTTATVTIDSSLLLLAEVRGWLSDNEQAMFKGTAIGHLLSVPESSKFSGTIIHFLLSREIHMDGKPDELHFKVGGKILHFGKREFALITGLSFKKPEKAFVPPADPPSLITTHFQNKYGSITGSDVRALLSKRNPTCTSLDRVKLALLLVIHRFLLGRLNSDNIKLVYFHLVDDLEEFNKYPWGEVTYDIAELRSPLLYHAKENSKPGRQPTYKVVGVSQVLLVWALEIMPGLLNLCGRRIESRGWKPHMLCVFCTRSPNYDKALIRTLEVNDVHVCSDVMWQKGDVNQLIVLGLQEGVPEVVDVDSQDSSQEREDSNHGYEVPETASLFYSKKRKVCMDEPRPCEEGKGGFNYKSVSKENENNIHHTNMKFSRGKDVQKWNTSSCSGAQTTEIENEGMTFLKQNLTGSFIDPLEKGEENLITPVELRQANSDRIDHMVRDRDGYSDSFQDRDAESKKTKISTEEPMMPTSEKDLHGNDVHSFSSYSEAHTTGIELFEVNASSSKCQTPDSTLSIIATSVDVIPSLICTTSASVQESVKGSEYMDIFQMPEENEIDAPHTSMKHSVGKDVHIGDSSCFSEKGTTGFEPLELLELFKVPLDSRRNASSSKCLTPDPTSVDATPSLIGSTSAPAPAQVKVEGLEFVGNLKIPEEYKTLYDNISKEHGHMATRNVIKFNDAMLLTCVTSLLKIFSDMETVLGAELTVALLDRWEGFVRDAETLEFNIKWLREGFSRLKNTWESSLKVDIDIESHEKVLDGKLGKYVSLLTRKEELETELSEINIEIGKAEGEISSEKEAIQEKQTQKIKFHREPVLGMVLNELNF